MFKLVEIFNYSWAALVFFLFPFKVYIALKAQSLKLIDSTNILIILLFRMYITLILILKVIIRFMN